MFFDKMAGMPAGAGGGLGGGAGGLSSGGMNPQSLAALMGMMGGGGGMFGGGPSLPPPPARGASGPGAMPAMPPIQQAAAPVPAAATAPQESLMQMLSKMDPAKLQELLASLGMRGNGVGAAASAFNAGGSSGLYNDPGGIWPAYTGGLT